VSHEQVVLPRLCSSQICWRNPLPVPLTGATRCLSRSQAVRELEKELERYRHLESEADASKAKGGIWGYISGQ